MKVGIDLSSTNTGLVILSDDNKLVFHGNFQLWDVDYKERFHKVANFVRKINDNLPYKIEKLPVEIGIELADFKNANITNRFNLLAGMIIFCCFYRISVSECYEERIIKIKLFNSNEWQRFLLDIYKHDIKCIKEIVGYEKYDDDGCVEEVPIYEEYYEIVYRNKTPSYELNSKDIIGGREYKSMRIEKNERALRKTLSRIFTEQNCAEYENAWTEDECDAYCIAYFLEKLRDRTQMHQEVKAKKVQAKKSEVQELRDKIKAYNKAKKLYEKVNHYKDIANVKKLTKAQQRALEKAEMELKENEKE